jgi:hypothetical protein
VVLSALPTVPTISPRLLMPWAFEQLHR